MANGMTQVEFEKLELKIVTMRDAFLSELSKHAELSRMYARLHELEHAAIDARRARREAELLEGGA